MPAFRFEKISPPVHDVAAPATDKQRGVVRQILHRVAAARVKRTRREENSAIVSRQQTPSD
ncbi:MAG: hypothetical protein ACRECL_06635 [Bradyrhizobium sp.]